ncbi:MAG: HDOD domain-containing protein [Gammaproteobacteria bacterium]|nr:MAG: HDOD domain-containing protein [Gammaproteobacteria bacterium]
MSMPLPSETTPEHAPALDKGRAAFRLVQGLAAELSAGRLSLPSLPEVVLRIQRTLADEDCEAEQIAELIASEPTFAGAILKLGNSVFYRRSGAETTSIVTCIARLGLPMVRSASMHFAMQQMREAEEFRSIRHLLQPEWESGQVCAGVCHSLARKTRRAHPDDMLTLGLVHNIGRIYLISRGAEFGDNDAAVGMNELFDEWHPVVGSAIAESWNLPEQAVQAIAQQTTPDAEQDFAHDINDLLGLAVALAAVRENAEAVAAAASTPAAVRLGVNEAALAAVVEDAREFSELLVY